MSLLIILNYLSTIQNFDMKYYHVDIEDVYLNRTKNIPCLIINESKINK